MSSLNDGGDESKEREIIFSKMLKAGSRNYYIDVKSSKNGDKYITITESKRVSSREEEVPRYEKHKLFLYKEDFDKFKDGLNEALDFIAASNKGE